MMPKKVADLMSRDVVTIEHDATVGDAMAAFVEHEHRHLPIVEAGNVVGVLSDRDVRRVEGLLALSVGSPEGSETVLAQPARELLSGEPICIDQSAPIDDAIDRLVEDRVGTLVVTDEAGSLVGMLSVVDVLKAARGRFS